VKLNPKDEAANK